MMTNKAKEIGAYNTNFVTPHGLDDPNHYTTAYDLSLIADYALDIPEIAQIVKQKYYTISINNNSKQIKNTNPLLGTLNGVDGMKTGFTNNAGRCLVTSVTRDEWQLIFVILGCDTSKQRTKESIDMIEYCYNNYKIVDLLKIAQTEYENAKVKVNKGKQEYVETMIEDLKNIIPLAKKYYDKIYLEYEICSEVEAPVYSNQKLGVCYLKIDDEIIAQMNIISKNDVYKKDETDYFMMLVYNISNYLQIKF